MVAAIVNGGLGLNLAGHSRGSEIAYGVVAGVIALVYIVVVILRRGERRGSIAIPGLRRRRTEKASANTSEERVAGGNVGGQL
jgi:hypothetical protein